MDLGYNPAAPRRHPLHGASNHQYVKDRPPRWLQPSSSSSRRHTPIDLYDDELPQPLAPVYHDCCAHASRAPDGVISQSRGPVIVTADHAPPPPTWHVNDSSSSSWHLQSQPSNIRPDTAPPIYTISSSDDDMPVTSADHGPRTSLLPCIDKHVTSSDSDESEGDEGEIDANHANHKEKLIEMSLAQKKKVVGSKEDKSCKHILHSLKLKKFALHSKERPKTAFIKKSKSLMKTKSLLKTAAVYKKLRDDEKKSDPEADLLVLEEYRVKVGEGCSPLKLIFTKSSKGPRHGENPAAVERKQECQEEGLKSSAAAESRAAEESANKGCKYEENTAEQYGKQTSCKSPSNNTKSHKEHDSSSGSEKAAGRKTKTTEVEMKKVHTRAEMMSCAREAKPETKPDAYRKEVVEKERRIVSDKELCRKFGCGKKARVVLRRLSKAEIQRFKHGIKKSRVHQANKPAGAQTKTKHQQVNSKIDERLQAAALMDLLCGLEKGKAKSSAAPARGAKILFAPRRVVKRHNTAATAVRVQKQRENKKKKVFSCRVFPREIIGLLERDVERAVPLERFINDEKRPDKIDWMLLDGKMQCGQVQRQAPKRQVKIRILMPPLHSATDVKSTFEEQKKMKAEALAKYQEHGQVKLVPKEVVERHRVMTGFFQKRMKQCCTEPEKALFKQKMKLASKSSFIDLFPTPKVSIEKQQDLLPNQWRSKKFSEPHLIGKYLLRAVNPLSREFVYVQRKFNKSCRERVVAIDKVENPHLWFRYQLEKDKLGLASPFVQELHLFHGTDKKHLDSILTYNLDWKRFGLKKGSRFGHGMYFTPLSSYALHYTDLDATHSIMILFRVLTVNQCIGYDDTKLPDPGFDTTISENGKVWVKFDTDQMYPDYVIHFNYDDPEAQFSRVYREKLQKKEAINWKKRLEEQLMWNEFRQKQQRRPMTWRRFYQRVKRWRLQPLKKSTGVRLKSLVWQGPYMKRAAVTSSIPKNNNPVVRDKLSHAPFKNMSIWKQPKQFKEDRKKPGAPYKAKKRTQSH